MERRFDMSDFERSLKDHADQFKLMPSKRVWNGIYNHLHPGSKWPSISIAIVFIITLISIGNLNNSPTRSQRDLQAAANKTVNKSESANQLSNNISTQKSNSQKDRVDEQSLNPTDINIQSSNSKNSFESDGQKVSRNSISTGYKNEKNSTISLIASAFSQNKNDVNQDKNLRSEFMQETASDFSVQNQDQGKNISIYRNNSKDRLPVIENTVLSEGINSLKKQILMQDYIREFIEPFEFLTSFNVGDENSKPTNNTNFDSQKATTTANAKKIRRKKNKNVEWTFYAAPTIGTISFNKKRHIAPPSSNVSSVIFLTNDPSFGLKRTPKIGFEAGAEMGYKISKKLKFITGANISYSGYNNMSNLIHPTFASLNFIDKNSIIYSKSYVTNYGNGQSPNRIPLTNYSFEVSVPLGLQYNIWKNEKIQIDAVSTVDPSIVLKKNAFIISSDGRYYINDPSLVRNVNLAGHFGSYISFYVNKIKWHIGPDLRYQLLSTYKSYYPYKEHFIDYGIRIGISR